MLRRHKDCINYSNGYCTLFNIPVPPEGMGCPQFQPKLSSPQSRGLHPASTSPTDTAALMKRIKRMEKEIAELRNMLNKL
ncbi:MAG TPA: hypothetical protein ENF41_03260 [Candidatus Bathyarchaeota archaeon]|nr:hypothetical protein [Candidatus Bathyarchaeota archaeon]